MTPTPLDTLTIDVGAGEQCLYCEATECLRMFSWCVRGTEAMRSQRDEARAKYDKLFADYTKEVHAVQLREWRTVKNELERLRALVPKPGAVVFEPTGETRCPKNGEWIKCEDGSLIMAHEDYRVWEYPIHTRRDIPAEPTADAKGNVVADEKPDGLHVVRSEDFAKLRRASEAWEAIEKHKIGLAFHGVRDWWAHQVGVCGAGQYGRSPIDAVLSCAAAIEAQQAKDSPASGRHDLDVIERAKP